MDDGFVGEGGGWQKALRAGGGTGHEALDEEEAVVDEGLAGGFVSFVELPGEERSEGGGREGGLRDGARGGWGEKRME